MMDYISSFVNGIENFMIAIGIIFIIIGISCFCYIHRKKHSDDAYDEHD